MYSDGVGNTEVRLFATQTVVQRVYKNREIKRKIFILVYFTTKTMWKTKDGKLLHLNKKTELL